eukprot:2772040-Amphidinium_carterae.1
MPKAEWCESSSLLADKALSSKSAFPRCLRWRRCQAGSVLLWPLPSDALGRGPTCIKGAWFGPHASKNITSGLDWVHIVFRMVLCSRAQRACTQEPDGFSAVVVFVKTRRTLLRTQTNRQQTKGR